MSLVEKINEDMVGAMKQRAVDRLSTLRMVKAALKNKEIDQRSPVTDAQAIQGVVVGSRKMAPSMPSASVPWFIPTRSPRPGAATRPW